VQALFVSTFWELLLASWLTGGVEDVLRKYRRVEVGRRERHVRGGTVEIKRVGWVQLAAQHLGRKAGSQVSTWAMLGRLAETQTTEGGGKTGQFAVLGRKGNAQKALHAVEHSAVKLMQHRGMASVGHQASRKHEFAKGGAMSQKDQSNCWVGDFTQSLQKVARFFDTFGSVSPTESVIPNWAA
jgi:hypothetical protein